MKVAIIGAGKLGLNITEALLGGVRHSDHVDGRPEFQAKRGKLRAGRMLLHAGLHGREGV